MQEYISKIQNLIQITERYKEKFAVIFINGNKQYTQANSGYLEDKEALEVEAGLSGVSSYYYFYNNPSTFVGDIILNKLPFQRNQLALIYSTAQIGVDVNRRSFIPNLASMHNIFNLTCDSYSLSLLQNKAHYYEISKNYVRVPKTLLFNGHNYEVFEHLTSKKYVIKPNLECSARGVKIVYSRSSVREETIELYREFRQSILIQEFKEGIEIEVPVIMISSKPVAFPPIKILKKNSYLTEQDVEYEEYSFEVYSDKCNISNIQNAAKAVMIALQCQGLCRADFIIDEFGTPWLFDIAAIPLISKHSSCYTVFRNLFPNDEYALYKTIIGAKLNELI